MTEAATPILSVRDLRVEFDTYGGTVHAVRGISFDVFRGKTLAIVGESGCGKSVSVQSIMGLTPMPPGRITSGTAMLRVAGTTGQDILRNRLIDGEDIRGGRIGMIFQDPMTSLNPTMRIGDQIAETLIVHRGYSKADANARAVELLHMTRIPEAGKRARQYPFEFSGGMLQRSMIAMALACEPSILIADEPTTALDVTIQAQILDLMVDLQRDKQMAIILITHDLGVVARMADEVVVMYAGEVVERGSADDIFYRSAHPYTMGLRAAMPTNQRSEIGGVRTRRNHQVSVRIRKPIHDDTRMFAGSQHERGAASSAIFKSGVVTEETAGPGVRLLDVRKAPRRPQDLHRRAVRPTMRRG